MLHSKLMLTTALAFFCLSTLSQAALAGGSQPDGPMEHSPENSPAKRQKIERLSSDFSDSQPEGHGEKRLEPDRDLQLEQEISAAKRQSITRTTTDQIVPSLSHKRVHGKGKNNLPKRVKQEKRQTMEERFPLTPEGYRALTQAFEESNGDLELLTEWIKRTTFEDLEKNDAPKTADPASTMDLAAIQSKNHTALIKEAFSDESYKPHLIDELFGRVFSLRLHLAFMKQAQNKLKHLLTYPEVYQKILVTAEYAHVFFSLPTLHQEVQKRYPNLLRDLKKKARKNTEDAMISLAFFYRHNEKIADYEAKYVKWIRKAAQEGKTKAFIPAGETYLIKQQQNTSEDLKTARSYFERAIPTDRGRALHALGFFALNTCDQSGTCNACITFAFDRFMESQNQGVYRSATQLALMLQNGQITTAENKETRANGLLMQSIHQGDTLAAKHLGAIYIHELQQSSAMSLPDLAQWIRSQDPLSMPFEAKAKTLFSIFQLASLEDKESLWHLGHLLEIGLATTQNPPLALAYQLLSSQPQAKPFVTQFLLNNQDRTVVSPSTADKPALDVLDLLHRTQRQQRKTALRGFVSQLPPIHAPGWFTLLRSQEMQEHIQHLITFNNEAIALLNCVADIQPGFLIDAVRPSEELESLLTKNPQEILSVVTLKNRNYFNLGQKNQNALKEKEKFKNFREKLKEIRKTLISIEILFVEAPPTHPQEVATTKRFLALIKEQESIVAGLKDTYIKFFTQKGLGARNADFLKKYDFWSH